MRRGAFITKDVCAEARSAQRQPLSPFDGRHALPSADSGKTCAEVDVREQLVATARPDHATDAVVAVVTGRRRKNRPSCQSFFSLSLCPLLPRPSTMSLKTVALRALRSSRSNWPTFGLQRFATRQRVAAQCLVHREQGWSWRWWHCGQPLLELVASGERKEVSKCLLPPALSRKDNQCSSCVYSGRSQAQCSAAVVRTVT